jgi:hypothetical protein
MKDVSNFNIKGIAVIAGPKPNGWTYTKLHMT